MADDPVGAVSEVADVVAITDALCTRLASVEIGTLSAMDAAHLAQAMARTERVCSVARARAGLRAVDTGANHLLGVANPTEWLAGLTQTGTGEARATLKLAEEVDASPPVAEALAAGDVSLAQAAEIVRTAKEVPGSEVALIAAAKGGSLDRLRDAARARRRQGVTAEELHARQHKLRSVKHWTDGDGMIAVLHTLLPEIGVPFVNRLEAAAAKLHREAKANGADEPFAAHLADAFAQLAGLHPARRAAGEPRGANVEISIVVDRNALVRGCAQDDEPCHLIGGGPIPVDTIRALAADAFLIGVLHDGVAVQRIKRFGRRYTAELLTALNLGDPPLFSGPSCTDCGSTFRLQRDHVDPVGNGGMTSLHNMKLRCDPCHEAKTRRDREAGLLGPNAPSRKTFRDRKRTRDRPPPTGPPGDEAEPHGQPLPDTDQDRRVSPFDRPG